MRLLPESARWLLTRKRTKEAEEIIYKIAAGNGEICLVQDIQCSNIGILQESLSNDSTVEAIIELRVKEMLMENYLQEICI